MNQSGLSLEDSITLDKTEQYLKTVKVLAGSPVSKQYLDEGENCLKDVFKNGLKKALTGLESAMEDMQIYINLTENYMASSIVRDYLVKAEAFIGSNEWEIKNRPVLQYCLDYSNEIFEHHISIYHILQNNLGISEIKQSLDEMRVFMESEEVETLKQILDDQYTLQPELTLDQLIRWSESLYEWGTRVDEIWQRISEFIDLFSGLH